MYKYTKDGISVLTSIDARTPKKNGLYPVRIQVVYKGKQNYYPTGKELSIDEWAKLPDSKVRKLIEIRVDVENSFSIIKDNVIALAEKGEFSLDGLKQRLGRSIGDTVNSAFEAKISSLKSEKQVGTMQYYQSAFKAFASFNGNNVSFDMISADWLTRYEKFLLLTKNTTTVGMYMIALRAIMNNAIKSGIIRENQYPFGKGKYEIKTGQSHKKALPLTAIEQIFKYTDGLETTERYRDLWLFVYLCNGINIADIVKLKYSNIVDGEIFFVRQKTERTSRAAKTIRAFITPDMETIINRWGTERKPDNYIFPYLKANDDVFKQKSTTKELTKRINMRMKKVGDALGISGITTYTARHSYATALKRGGAGIAFISESMGHTDLKTTESYLASFETDERRKNALMLTNFKVEKPIAKAKTKAEKSQQ